MVPSNRKIQSTAALFRVTSTGKSQVESGTDKLMGSVPVMSYLITANKNSWVVCHPAHARIRIGHFYEEYFANPWAAVGGESW